MSYVLAFIPSGIVVALAGTALARYADDIAEATKRGRLCIGSVLPAGATSLPELTFRGADGPTDLAVGDLFGASITNMLILAVIQRIGIFSPFSDCSR
jgi:cation:H+ antiporter